MIPFVDLDAQYNSIKQDVRLAIDGILESKDFIHGKSVAKFQEDFAKAHGCKHVIGCANGTSAITVALRALNIGLGDEVITVANSFFATPEAIAEVGAVPVFVDCDPRTYGIDINLIEEKITKKTKAIIPVHLYGNPVNMTAVMNIARKHNLRVIEDCAQAHLAKWKGQAVGTFGDVGTFSFYPGKNLGAYGDAGAIVTQNDDLAKNLGMQVNHGRIKKYEHDFLAGNFRMDGIQAAVLSVKIKHITNWTNDRKRHAAEYSRLLAGKLSFMEVASDAECVFHIFLVEVSNRDEVMSHFSKLGIQCGIHYPIPLHLQPALSHLGGKKGDFLVSEKLSSRILSLPMYPELNSNMINDVVTQLLLVAKN